MIKAVLIDLDNTLIKNPDQKFASTFLAQFEKHFYQTLKIENAGQLFKQAIRDWAKSTYQTDTNQIRLAHIISSHCGISEDEALVELERFYEKLIPFLASHIEPIPGAAEALVSLLKLDIAIAITTNPFYPHSTIKKRMQLGNLPDDAPYTLITSSENMHYSKENPAYYAEVVARMGIEPDEALVIGDNLRNDIQHAELVGLHAIHVNPEKLLTFKEAIDQLNTKIDWYTDYKLLELKPEMILPQWQGNIAALFSLLENVKSHFWDQKSIPNEWTILQILTHLIEVEKSTHRARLERILLEENPFITAPPPPGPDLPVHNSDGYTLAYAFLEERKKTTEFIQSLTREEWFRPAQHSIFSKTTLLEMAYFTAQHDRLHINQLCQTLGQCK